MIPMDSRNQDKMTFMTNSENFFYTVMPFCLKIIGENYQMMKKKEFKDRIGHMLKVNIDDMLMKSFEDPNHMTHVREVSKEL